MYSDERSFPGKLSCVAAVPASTAAPAGANLSIEMVPVFLGVS